MFLPMSWTSPFTVAITTRPLVRSASPGCLSASMNGMRWATALFFHPGDLARLGVPRSRRLDDRAEVGARLLHPPRGLHHLRQEHLPGAEQVTDHVHPAHQRALDDLDRPAAARGARPPRPRGGGPVVLAASFAA